MIDYPRLLPECNTDTLLVNMLIRSTASHKRSVTEVFKALKDYEVKRRKAIGIIDGDKDVLELSYYRQYTLVEDCRSFKHLAHPNGLHELIVVQGGVENFIISCAEEVGYSHRILEDFERFKRLTKSDEVFKNNDIKNILNTIIQRNSPTLIKMRGILATITPF